MKKLIAMDTEFNQYLSLALVRCSIEADQGGTPHARARVSLVSWEGRSHALLFMVPLGLPSARPMAQVLRLPFEYYIYIYISFLGIPKNENSSADALLSRCTFQFLKY